MAVFSQMYTNISYFVKVVNKCQNIQEIPAILDEPSCVLSELLRLERQFSIGDTTGFPSKEFMENHNNSWVILFTAEAFFLSSGITHDVINEIIKNYDCTRLFVVTQHQMQTDYVSRIYPSLNIIGTHNEWEYCAYIYAKHWPVKDTTHYLKRFLFMNRRNDSPRSRLFYNLWNIPGFPENAFASFNPGNYWGTSGLTEDAATAVVQDSWKEVLDLIDDKTIVDWLIKTKFPQLPEEYSEQDPMHYSWDKNNGLGSLMNDTAINIVAETVTYPTHQKLFTTEKIFRPIIAGQPFITLASTGYLRGLRSLGYRTFGDIWDEGYDDIYELNDRVTAIGELVKQLNNMSVAKFENVLKRCRKICAHNRKVIEHRTSIETLLNNIGEPFKSELTRNPYKYKYEKRSKIYYR